MIKHPSFINHIHESGAESPLPATIAGRLFQLPIIMQLFRFFLIGTTAAAVHFCIVVSLVQLANFKPLIANACAFLVSFQISYWGNRLWTFSESDASHRVAYSKLLLVQLANFAVSEFYFYLLLQMHLHYQIALIIVMGTMPIFTFACNKLWVFK